MELSRRSSSKTLNSVKDFSYGQRIINQKYRILHKIADEQYSKVFSISTLKNTKQVIRAIKFQNQLTQFPQISKEVSVLKSISSQNQLEIGFPRFYQYGCSQGQNYLITKLLGPNIAQLHRLCNSRFSSMTCLLIGLQILDRLQKLHELGYVYRDIRLENFVIGLGHQSSFIFMIDFGHCQRFRCRQTSSHMPYKQGNSNLDDATFMSVNVHNNVRYARRDDIQSLFYLIIYMLKSKLPWRKVQGKSKKERDDKIGDFKKAVSPSYLSSNFGIEMADLIWYIRSVNFYQKPDYDFIRNKIYSMILAKSQIKTSIQVKYDWNERQEMDYTIYNGQPKLFLNKSQPQQEEQDDAKGDQDIQRTLKTQEINEDEQPLI